MRDDPGQNPARTWLAALRWPTWLPPTRLTWVALAAVGLYGVGFLRGLGLASLGFFPIAGAVVDLLFQRVRFPSLRPPDSALATALFLALILPPSVSVWEGALVVGAAVAFRHVLRFRSRPLFNPAASGVLLGTLLVGMAPAWWVGLGTYGEVFVVALGLLLLVRTPSSWRLPVSFFVVYATFSILQHYLFGAVLAPRVLLLSALDPVVVFFGLFMVPEPRSSPSDSAAHAMFGAVVALGAVFLSTVLPTLGILSALLLGNLLSAALRARRVADIRSAPGPRRGARRSSAASRWSLPRRAGVGFLVLFLVGSIAAVVYSPSPTPAAIVGLPPGGGAGGSGGGGLGTNACTSDNASIPSATLTQLHNLLGPSVVLSYDGNTGRVVFYDPVNSVTVTETDLYEDYGYAEFNGDDYAVPGCSG